MTEICNFPTLFMTWPIIRCPIYDRWGWHSCPKHNLRRAFDKVLMDNRASPASHVNTSKFSRRKEWRGEIPVDRAHMKRPSVKNIIA